jgi:hypothetical protein
MSQLQPNERYIIYARLKKGEKANDLAREFGIPTYNLLMICERIRKAKPRNTERSQLDHDKVLGIIRSNPHMTTPQIAEATSYKYHSIRYILKKHNFVRVFVGHRMVWFEDTEGEFRSA